MNHFCLEGAVVQECGMFVVGAVMQQYVDCESPLAEGLTQLEKAGCRLGASPDGILVHENGLRECIEVKCVCPFAPSAGGFVTNESKFQVARSVSHCMMSELEDKRCPLTSVHTEGSYLVHPATAVADALRWANLPISGSCHPLHERGSHFQSASQRHVARDDAEQFSLVHRDLYL